jgi:hypothetical protein
MKKIHKLHVNELRGSDRRYIRTRGGAVKREEEFSRAGD